MYPEIIDFLYTKSNQLENIMNKKDAIQKLQLRAFPETSQSYSIHFSAFLTFPH